MPDHAEMHRPSDARGRILEVAERLYALHGIDAVSIRQINQEAGQKNGSAIHYHFGSRDGLLDAIFDLRVKATNERRLQVLDRVKALAGRHLPPLRAIADAIVLPMFENIKLGQRTYDRRFVKQIHTQHHLMDRFLSKRYAGGLREGFRLIGRCRPDIPRPILYHRYIHVSAIAIDAAANLEERNDREPDTLTQQRIDLHVACCIDSVVSVFDAPVSKEAHDLVGDPRRPTAALERMHARAPL